MAVDRKTRAAKPSPKNEGIKIITPMARTTPVTFGIFVGAIAESVLHAPQSSLRFSDNVNLRGRGFVGVARRNSEKAGVLYRQIRCRSMGDVIDGRGV